METTILSFILLSIIQISTPYHVRKLPEVPTNPKNFPSELFSRIAAQNQYNNIIFSPFSIKSALTLLYLGAEGETEEELRTGLQYKSCDKVENVNSTSQVINKNSIGSVQLKMSNRIYTNYEILTKYNEIASKHLQAEAETISFKDNEKAANIINSWVEEATNNKIKDLINSNSIDGNTAAILVNAIYFKAEWLEQFSKRTTRKEPFWISASKSVEVDTMSGEISCNYGEFMSLGATAIEMKYENNDMSMLIILPNQRDGLRGLEVKLQHVDLTTLSTKMKEVELFVNIPKFKIEFESMLIPVLEEMGMKKAFGNDANYKSLFNSDVPVKISDVVHKAFIEVNEYGSEAAASTYVKAVFLMGSDPRPYNIDHPFVFAIKDKENVFFIGHVVEV